MQTLLGYLPRYLQGLLIVVLKNTVFTVFCAHAPSKTSVFTCIYVVLHGSTFLWSHGARQKKRGQNHPQRAKQNVPVQIPTQFKGS